MIDNIWFQWLPINTVAFCCLLICIKLVTCCGQDNVTKSQANLKSVPVVGGTLPILGHALQMHFKKNHFIEECYQIYGGIFQIRVFLVDLVVLCDPSLVSSYLKQSEKKLSFSSAVTDMGFDWTIFEASLMDVEQAITFFSKVVRLTSYDAFVYMLQSSGQASMDRLMTFCANGVYKCDLNEEMSRCIMGGALACFAPIQLNDALFDDLSSFYHLSEKLIMSSFLAPRWALKLIFQRKLRSYKDRLVPYFVLEIQKHRQNPGMCESELIRMVLQDGQHKFSNEQIAELIIGFMHLATSNTTILLANTITQLSRSENKTWLERIRQECMHCLGDLPKFFASPLLNAFVLETARVTTQILGSQRDVLDPDFCLGDFFIGNKSGRMTLAPRMLQMYGPCSDTYRDPTKFLPERFLGHNAEPEPQTAPYMTTWGGGRHVCPGRNFSIKQAKIALSQFVLSFDFEVADNIPDLSYDTLAVFGQHDIKMNIRKREVSLQIQ